MLVFQTNSIFLCQPNNNNNSKQQRAHQFEIAIIYRIWLNCFEMPSPQKNGKRGTRESIKQRNGDGLNVFVWCSASNLARHSKFSIKIRLMHCCRNSFDVLLLASTNTRNGYKHTYCQLHSQCIIKRWSFQFTVAAFFRLLRSVSLFIQSIFPPFS